MVYLIIGITLFCLSLKGYCGKKTSCYAKDTADACLFNFLRMFFCIFVGAALVLAAGVQDTLAVAPGMALICLFSAVANAMFMISWLFAVKKNSLVSVDVALTLGSLIPSVFCAIFFDEPLSAPKFIGFALILLATALLVKKGKKVKGSASGLVLLILAMLGDGFIGLSQQLYRQFYTDAGRYPAQILYDKTVFHFYTYVFAAVLLLSVWAICRLAGKKKAEQDGREVTKPLGALTWRIVAYIAVMAVCLFGGNYFQTVATNDYGVSSQLLYPILKGGCLITVNFVGMFCFGEKMTRRTALGMLIALCGIVTMGIA